MRSSRRIKRMSRNRGKMSKMNLTSLMDVFTILVFFLLVNSASSQVVDAPREITLPESDVESMPRETVVIFVGPEEVLVQGEPVVTIEEIVAMDELNIAPITERLAALNETVIGVSTQTVAQSEEVTILADKSIPFSVIRRIMSTCTEQGYGHISLAVIQEASQA